MENNNIASNVAKMVDVQIKYVEDEAGKGWEVCPIWSGVDRPNVGGWRLSRRQQADRLVKALMAGAVLYNLEVRTDVDGNTYVSSTSRVMARYINADLKRIGF